MVIHFGEFAVRMYQKYSLKVTLEVLKHVGWHIVLINYG
jgi:hypothetical protein